jgi:predicted ABC-class ATPase
MSELASDLARCLERLDGRPYPAYKDLRRRTDVISPYRLTFEHIQGDPFAAPSRIRVEVPQEVVNLPGWATANPASRRAAADFLHRRVYAALSGTRHKAGSGKSGLLEIAPLGQEVLDRTAVRVDAEGRVCLRLTVGLPAGGRRILGRAARELLTERLPRTLDRAVVGLDLVALETHVHCVEDQLALRSQLGERGLIAFLAERSILPRRSGVDMRPMPKAVPLEVPESLMVTLETPHAGLLRGLGIPCGVTLIVGGGYHGKSTLLSVLALGVYEHIPDDGRERCVSDAGAVTVRAEDGRSVRGVDLRPFIGHLPLGRDTERFDTDDASGSTSQAAAIVEVLEAGASVLLVDEDTAATNFMIRDGRMRELVPTAKEPITPYLDRVRQLWEERGVSSVLVVGGAGDYLDVADTVLQMDAYRPRDVTSRAREVARALPLGPAAPRAPGPWAPPAARIPDPRSLDPSRGRRPERVRSVKTRAIEFGREEIDVALLYQLVDPAQCRMIGDVLLAFSRELCDGRRSVPELLDEMDARITNQGLEALSEPTFGDRSRARRFEVAAALNRLRGLRLIDPRDHASQR